MVSKSVPEGSAIESLEDLGIVREITGKHRDRTYVYDPYVKILDEGTQPLPWPASGGGRQGAVHFPNIACQAISRKRNDRCRKRSFGVYTQSPPLRLLCGYRRLMRNIRPAKIFCDHGSVNPGSCSGKDETTSSPSATRGYRRKSRNGPFSHSAPDGQVLRQCHRVATTERIGRHEAITRVIGQTAAIVCRCATTFASCATSLPTMADCAACPPRWPRCAAPRQRSSAKLRNRDTTCGPLAPRTYRPKCQNRPISHSAPPAIGPLSGSPLSVLLLYSPLEEIDDAYRFGRVILRSPWIGTWTNEFFPTAAEPAAPIGRLSLRCPASGRTDGRALSCPHHWPKNCSSTARICWRRSGWPSIHRGKTMPRSVTIAPWSGKSSARPRNTP